MLLLGRYWPYMTPRYVFEEMTLEEVQEAVGHVLRWELHPESKKHYEHMVKGMEQWLCPGGISVQDLSWITPPIGKVIRKRG